MTNPFRVKPVDYFEQTVCAADADYIYRVADTAYERASKTDLGTWSTTSTFASIVANYSATTAYLILESGTHLAIASVSGQVKVYRSTDSGFNWSFVRDLDYGGLGGNRSWCEGPNGSVYFVEYDDTGAGSSIRLYESTDDGATFVSINQWIDAIKHGHCVRYLGGYLYVGVGDSDSESGIIRWDFIGDWANIGNTAPKDVSASGFIGVGGDQRYRCTDIIEFNGKLYHFADANNTIAGSAGIYQFDYDLTNWININNEVRGFSEYAGYFALSTPSQALFIPYISSSGGVDNDITIWAVTSDSSCEQVAVFRCEDIAAQKNIRSFFVDGDNIYLGATYAAGDNKTRKSTAVIQNTTEEFKGPFLDVVHPVFWCNSTGDNTNDGSDPRNAKADIGDALSSSSTDRICQGACVMAEDATYSETAYTYGSWTTTQYAAENVYTQLRGAGREATVYTLTGGTNGLTQGGSVSKLLISDMTVDYDGNENGSLWIGNTGATGEMYAQDAVFGVTGNSYRRCIQPRDTDCQIYRCLLNQGSDADTSLVIMPDNGAGYTSYSAKFYACVFNGGIQGAFLYNNAAFEAYQCAFVNFLDSGIRTLSGATVLPIAKGCFFATTSGLITVSPFDDDASQTWSNTNNDYNILYGSSSAQGVANTEIGTNSWMFQETETYNPRTAGVLFTDPLNLDFTPTEQMKKSRRMPQKYTDYGYDGVAYSSEPTIGVYGDATWTLRISGGTGEQAIISHNIIKH